LIGVFVADERIKSVTDPAKSRSHRPDWDSQNARDFGIAEVLPAVQEQRFDLFNGQELERCRHGGEPPFCVDGRDDPPSRVLS
jgi:hypothetical protein